uniref:response regulator transcription factor n=1 Tax=Coprococcus sp. TaxID=2049024 RepID=UPI003FF0B058
MPKLLVIEDDREINHLICEYMAEAGYEMLSASNGLEGLSMLERIKDIDLCLLDLMLPMKSGDRVIAGLREFSEVPVIVLSAKDTIQTKIDLFRMGADDYITKPFDLDELLVRVEAVLKRITYRAGAGENWKPEQKAGQSYSYKNLVLDDQAKIVRVNGNKLDLTVKEYGILKLLLENPKKLFSKANLFESVWNETYYPEDNALKVHMSNLRTKIKKYDDREYIETVWGMGYKLAD